MPSELDVRNRRVHVQVVLGLLAIAFLILFFLKYRTAHTAGVSSSPVSHKSEAVRATEALIASEPEVPWPNPEPVQRHASDPSPVSPADRIGPGGLRWIAWRMLYLSAFPDSPPCTVRLPTEKLSVRFRALWDAPGGPPPDPDFLEDIRERWEEQVIRLILHHSRLLSTRISEERSKLCSAFDDEKRGWLHAWWTAVDERLIASWQDRLKPSSPVIALPRTSTEPVSAPLLTSSRLWTQIMERTDKNHPLLLSPAPGATWTWTPEAFDDLLVASHWTSGERRLLLESRKREVSSWTDSLESLALELEALSETTERPTLHQLGPDMQEPLLKAFKIRRLVDRHLACARRQLFVTLIAGSAPSGLWTKDPSVELEDCERRIMSSEQVTRNDRALFEAGIIRVPMTKAKPSTRPAAWEARRFLDAIESGFKNNNGQDANREKF